MIPVGVQDDNAGEPQEASEDPGGPTVEDNVIPAMARPPVSISASVAAPSAETDFALGLSQGSPLHMYYLVVGILKRSDGRSRECVINGRAAPAPLAVQKHQCGLVGDLAAAQAAILTEEHIRIWSLPLPRRLGPPQPGSCRRAHETDPLRVLHGLQARSSRTETPGWTGLTFISTKEVWTRHMATTLSS